jgi:DNA-binding transcriptional LysR family regulator
VHERWAATTASATIAPQSLRRTFEDRDLPMPQIALTSEGGEMNRRLIAASDLLGVAARPAVERNAERYGVKIIPVRDLSWIRPVYLVYRNDGYLSPVARRFIGILRTIAKGIGANA